MNLKHVPKWAWIVAALLAVGIFIYFKRHGSSSTGTAAAGIQGTLPDDAQAAFENQLATDVAARVTGAIGGIPSSVDPGAVTPPTNGGANSTLPNMPGVRIDPSVGLGDFANGLGGAGIRPRAGGYIADWEEDAFGNPFLANPPVSMTDFSGGISRGGAPGPAIGGNPIAGTSGGFRTAAP